MKIEKEIKKRYLEITENESEEIKYILAYEIAEIIIEDLFALKGGFDTAFYALQAFRKETIKSTDNIQNKTERLLRQIDFLFAQEIIDRKISGLLKTLLFEQTIIVGNKDYIEDTLHIQLNPLIIWHATIKNDNSDYLIGLNIEDIKTPWPKREKVWQIESFWNTKKNELNLFTKVQTRLAYVAGIICSIVAYLSMCTEILPNLGEAETYFIYIWAIVFYTAVAIVAVGLYKTKFNTIDKHTKKLRYLLFSCISIPIIFTLADLSIFQATTMYNYLGHPHSVFHKFPNNEHEGILDFINTDTTTLNINYEQLDIDSNGQRYFTIRITYQNGGYELLEKGIAQLMIYHNKKEEALFFTAKLNQKCILPIYNVIFLSNFKNNYTLDYVSSKILNNSHIGLHALSCQTYQYERKIDYDKLINKGIELPDLDAFNNGECSKGYIEVIYKINEHNIEHQKTLQTNAT